MFAESIIETSWAEGAQRSWTTLTSFGLQIVVIGVLLAIPVLRTVGLPRARVLQPPVSLAPRLAPLQHGSPDHGARLNQSNLAENTLIAPLLIPGHVARINENVPPPQVSYGDEFGGPRGIEQGSREGIIGAIDGSVGHLLPAHAPAALKPPFRSSNLLQGSLLRRVEPVYPPSAKAARIQGLVVLAAIISKAGSIEHLQVLSGHPMLVKAAADAVSQWQYRPYLLNGEVIEVETQITVNFKLN